MNSEYESIMVFCLKDGVVRGIIDFASGGFQNWIGKKGRYVLLMSMLFAPGSSWDR
jgi:hypothetical protein